MTTLQTQLAAYERGLDTMRQFVAEYGDRLPKGLLHLDKVPVFMVLLRYKPELERINFIRTAGYAFGTDGWTATPDSNGNMDWRKTLDSGMQVVIYAAEVLPKQVATVVFPSHAQA